MIRENNPKTQARPNPAKFCIFCGERPTNKTKEHVLPRWLIELTGNPKREAVFDVDPNRRPFELRRFAFDQFTFPACSECNSAFSTLETAVKPIVERLLGAECLNAGDFDVLLDWLDKVRVGLWLAKYFLDKNFYGIDPNFHIGTRMRTTDRSVVIFKTDESRQRLNTMGTFGPGFQTNPIAVGLVINNYLLINISHIDLCSRRLGFPFMEARSFLENKRLSASAKAGLERTISPVIPSFPHPTATGIYQPIFSAFFQSEETSSFVDTPYVRSNSIDWREGIGSVFIQNHGQVKRYSDIHCREWSPSKTSIVRAIKVAHDFISQRQLDHLRQGIRLAGGDTRRRLREHLRGVETIHKILQKKRHE